MTARCSYIDKDNKELVFVSKSEFYSRFCSKHFSWESLYLTVRHVQNMVHTCTLCDRLFESLSGLNIHQAHCKFKQVVINRTNWDIITEKVFINENIVVETSTIVEIEEIDIEI